MLSDTFADFLTRLRNASRAQQRYVDVFANKMILNVVKILKDQGFVAHYLVAPTPHKTLVRVFLKYDEARQPLIKNARRISKPSCRRYVRAEELYPVLGGMGIGLVSTSKGVMTSMEARAQNLGGEYLCTIS